jgi:hypothetical protein
MGSPQLLSRHISLNPLESAAEFLNNNFRQLDLFLATAVDKQGLTWVAALGNGLAAAGVGAAFSIPCGALVRKALHHVA